MGSVIPKLFIERGLRDGVAAHQARNRGSGKKWKAEAVKTETVIPLVPLRSPLLSVVHGGSRQHHWRHVPAA